MRDGTYDKEYNTARQKKKTLNKREIRTVDNVETYTTKIRIC